jgi:CDC45-like protein
LNVGGLVDLEAFLELPSTTTLYLIDSHRPLHLRNLFGSTQIVAIDDGSISAEMKELRLSYEAAEVDKNLKISLIRILGMIAKKATKFQKMKKNSCLIQILLSKKRNLLVPIKISIRTIGQKFPLMKMMSLQNHQILQRLFFN